MNIINQKVTHNMLGVGTVISQTEKHIIVGFTFKEIKMQYPDAFKTHLILNDPDLQEKVNKEIQQKEFEKVEELKRIASQHQTQKQRDNDGRKTIIKLRADRPNIAFKCNYCDGGKSSSSIGFNGVCSEKIIRYNIDVEQRTWCCSEECHCYNYLLGYMTREELDAQVEDGGFVCYESQMLRDWKAMAGIVQRGERKGQPMRLSNVQANSLCILTTREPDSTEGERFIFAVFLVDETYEGDDCEEGYVSTQSKFKIPLTPSEAKAMPFWRYHANENQPEKEAWSSGLHRYLTDIQAVQILRDIVELKKNTKYENLAKDFLETFCEINGIDQKLVGEPEGALTKQ